MSGTRDVEGRKERTTRHLSGCTHILILTLSSVSRDDENPCCTSKPRRQVLNQPGRAVARTTVFVSGSSIILVSWEIVVYGIPVSSRPAETFVGVLIRTRPLWRFVQRVHMYLLLDLDVFATFFVPSSPVVVVSC